MIKTNKFVRSDYIPNNNTLKLVDRRNNIECYGFDPGVDKVMDLYFNYITLLNGLKDKWKCFGYLDFGMIPVVMGPSFLHTALKEVIIGRLNDLRIEFHMLPCVSLMTGQYKYVLGDTDVWVRRDLAAELMGINVEQVTVEKFLRWCMQ